MGMLEGHFSRVDGREKTRKLHEYQFSRNSRFTVYNWLADIPKNDLDDFYPIIEVSFHQGSRKSFFQNTAKIPCKEGEYVVVESGTGYDVGVVSLTGELVKWQIRKKCPDLDINNLSKVKKLAEPFELDQLKAMQEKEHDILVRSRELVKEQKLQMKITMIEIQADGRKITFYYTANTRIDFRELIKILAGEFKSKIEMRQISVRVESGKLGGLGSCGREICTSTWLTDYKPVNLNAARKQGLSINMAKLTGPCGRLKCCLNFELDMYIDALKHFPKNADRLQLEVGEAILQKRDIFRNLMWYSLPGNNKQYPLTIERVKEILALNQKGEKAESLQPTEVKSRRYNTDMEDRSDMGFVNDVGQLTLTTIAPPSRKKKKKGNYKKNRPNPNSAQTTAQANRKPNKKENSGGRGNSGGKEKPKRNHSAPKKAKNNS